MEKNTIIKFCFISIIFLSFVLFLIIENREYEIMEISKIEKSDYNKLISIYGEIEKYSNYNEMHFFSLKDNTSSIDVVSFSIKNISISNGDKVLVVGNINFYNGKIQLIAKEIYVEK